MNRSIVLFYHFLHHMYDRLCRIESERYIDNNVFFSSADPKMAVKVNSELPYIGKYEKKHHVSSVVPQSSFRRRSRPQL
jgi:hypothetical protein